MAPATTASLSPEASCAAKCECLFLSYIRSKYTNQILPGIQVLPQIYAAQQHAFTSPAQTRTRPMTPTCVSPLAPRAAVLPLTQRHTPNANKAASAPITSLELLPSLLRQPVPPTPTLLQLALPVRLLLLGPLLQIVCNLVPSFVSYKAHNANRILLLLQALNPLREPTPPPLRKLPIPRTQLVSSRSPPLRLVYWESFWLPWPCKVKPL